MPRVIGILGGMGPEATVLFMSRILRRTPAQDDSDHVPLLVDSNTQVPSRIRHLIERDGPDPTPTLAAMARRLEASGAEALAMPCNTAHSYLEAVASSVAVPFLDMPRLTAVEVAERTPDGPVGILASPAVEITGIFATAFAETGRGVLYPKDRNAMLGAIRAVKAGREEEALPVLRAASDELAARGAVAAVVACSEFSLLSPRLGASALPVFDSLDALVEAAVAFALDDAAPPEKRA